MIPRYLKGFKVQPSRRPKKRPVKPKKKLRPCRVYQKENIEYRIINVEWQKECILSIFYWFKWQSAAKPPFDIRYSIFDIRHGWARRRLRFAVQSWLVHRSGRFDRTWTPEPWTLLVGSKPEGRSPKPPNPYTPCAQCPVGKKTVRILCTDNCLILWGNSVSASYSEGNCSSLRNS